MYLVEFVEKRGGGVIFSSFRCGVLRSLIRPIFPEVAYAWRKVNGAGLRVVRRHPITEGLPEKFLTTYCDHGVLRLGARGVAPAIDMSGEVASACSEVGRGRVVFIGSWIGISPEGKPVYPLPSMDRRLLLNSIRWIAPRHKVSGDSTISDEVMLRVLRRERIIDSTHDGEGC